MRRRLWDFLGKWLIRRGNANTMFALADKCHGWQRKGGPVMMKSTWPLSFRKSHSLRRIYVRGSSPFLLGYEKHPNYLGRAFENTCAEVKNKNLVCAKNRETHADNSKTRIRYVQKSRKHMQTAPPNCGLLFFEKLHGSIEDKFPCRYFWGRVKNKN